MADLLITIARSSVLEEVSKTTAYLGAKNKLEDGKPAFDQMLVKEEDLSLIGRFYQESVDVLKNLLQRFIAEINDDGDKNVNWKLEMSDRFDTKMEVSIISSASSFLVNSIIGKWCEITANDKVKDYADNAAACLKDIKDKVFFKSAPTRVKPSGN